MSRMLCAVAAVILALVQVGKGDVFDIPNPATMPTTPPVAASTPYPPPVSATTPYPPPMTAPPTMTAPPPIAATSSYAPPVTPPPPVMQSPTAQPPTALAPPMQLAQAPAIQPTPAISPSQGVPPSADAPSPYSNLAPIVGEGYSEPPVISPAMQNQGEAWIGGVSMLLLKPHWTGGNTGVVTRTDSSTGLSAYTTNDFSYGYQASPGAWFGYLNSAGNGIRVNFFQYQQGATINSALQPNQVLIDAFSFGSLFGVYTLSPGAQLTAMSALKLSYFDLEAMKRVNTLNWQWTASAGVRYAYLSQSYQSSVTPANLAANGGSNLSERHFFNGAGPTVSFMGRRPIGDSPLGIFGSGRASMLFGNDSQSISEAYLSGLAGSYYRASWGVLPQAELEFGADFRRPFGQRTLIIENALTGQSWFGAGTSSGSSAQGGNVNQATLGFYGWRASVGMTY